MDNDRKLKEIDPKLLEELKAKHGNVVVLTADEACVQVACKRPDRATYKRFKVEIGDANKKTSALENLCLTCLVHPSREEFERLLDEMPALGDTFGAALWDKVVGAEDASAKKV